MKKTLIAATVFATLASPAFAGSQSIEIKVPLAPTAEDVVQAHEAVLEAAKTVCSDTPYRYTLAMSRFDAQKRCVEATYKAAVESAQADNLVAFMNSDALIGTEFE